MIAPVDHGSAVDPMTGAQRLCALCVQVAGVSGVALSVASADTRSTVWATDDLSDRLEDLQDTLGEGPTVDALRDGESVLIADLATSGGRWPAFSPAAAEAGVGAMFVLPLRMGSAHIGTLALHRTEAGRLEDEQFKDAWVLAEAATVLLMLSPPDAEDVGASGWVLGDRSRFHPEVHQAVGVTMVHLDVSARDAFARICAHAFASNTPVGAVAAQIVARELRLEMDRRD
jgi:hypothetical protein